MMTSYGAAVRGYAVGHDGAGWLPDRIALPEMPVQRCWSLGPSMLGSNKTASWKYFRDAVLRIF
jgi:hypothetical protein